MLIFYDHSLNYNRIIMAELNFPPRVPLLEETKELAMTEPLVAISVPTPEKSIS
jgi:hypothetical protein